ncbi:RNA polymerase I-specific transcription initiation factor RRN3-like [Tubulanus polymorphus]|uniref:RNA polymerase I-specific transcription initiation factor RRN3-like n=1 Tax=Tubulanus polymorphus TaxID=672921 RepID=UPI003DA1E596
MEPIEISEILENYKNGSSSASKPYNVLISNLSDPNVKSVFIVKVLRGLSDFVTNLDKKFEHLIGTVLKLDWPNREPRVVIEYQTFILNLISANTFYLKSCLKSFITRFRPSDDTDVNDVIDEQRNKDGLIFLNIHAILRSIVKIVPMAPKILMPLLIDYYPYITRSGYHHECYLKNLLLMPQYLTNDRRQILALIVGKLLELDTRSPRQAILDAIDDETEDDDNEDEEMNVDEIFVMDESLSAEKAEVQEKSTDQLSHSEANKLDILMEILLQYIHNTCFVSGQLNWEETKKLYKELLGVFEDVILPTHSSSHVQYLLFYICSFKQPLADGFIDYLWKKVKNPNTQPIYRQAAVAYMCGLISRGLFVPISTAVVTMEHMSQWIHSYIQQSSYSVVVDVTRHRTFYSVCQALFYIFIFRHKEILQSQKGYKFSLNLNLQAIVTCRLNPLKICLPVIVKTFSSVTRQHQIAFCDTIIEHNNRAFIPVTTLDRSHSYSQLCHTNSLDSFFPFDPYILPRSKHAIEPLYREYSGNPIEDDDNDSTGEDEDEFLKEQLPDHSVEVSMAKSPTQLLLYGSSPGFKHT